jgi:hypothetical protein
MLSISPIMFRMSETDPSSTDPHSTAISSLLPRAHSSSATASSTSRSACCTSTPRLSWPKRSKFAVSATSATLSPLVLGRPTLSSLPLSMRRKRRTLGIVYRTLTRAASLATPLRCRPSRSHTSTKATSRDLPSSANPTRMILLTGRCMARMLLLRLSKPRAS